ncbi:MAG: hypothetical protein H6Q52_754 [Deltaproteobacteria bacterium]|nr:hypothetical protein [Deltaproteobacteria bacterium]
MSKALHFFSHAEKEKIKEATSAAESKTIGEIAVMIVDSSTRYREGETLGAITLGNVLAFLITVFFLHESLWWYIPLTLAFFILWWLVFQKIPSATLHFTGTKRRQLAVRDRAIRAFYEKGLHGTRGKTGMLFFISLLERKVWVLADKGIHEKISQAKLNTFAKNISNGIRNGDASGALIQAIKEAGELLHQHFPIEDGDANELPDTIIFGGEEQ